MIHIELNVYIDALIVIRQLYGGIPDVLVPEMYLDYTTRRVLVMEWVEVIAIAVVLSLFTSLDAKP